MKKVIKGIPYTNEQFARIERSLGEDVRLTDKNRTALNLAKRKWEACIALLPERPPSKEELGEENRKRVEDIKDKIAGLIESLESEGHLILSHGLSHDRLVDCLYIALRQAEAEQNKIGEPSKKTIRKKAGRTPEIHRQDFFFALAEIFEDITGKTAKRPAYSDYKGEFSGGFFEFVKACIEPIEKIQDTTLGSAISKIFPLPNKI